MANVPVAAIHATATINATRDIASSDSRNENTRMRRGPLGRVKALIALKEEANNRRRNGLKKQRKPAPQKARPKLSAEQKSD